LRWLGPWSLTSFLGRLDDERVIDDALLFGLRVSAKPLPRLEIGLSRTAQFCGEDRPCSASTFADLLLGRDNKGVNVAAGDEPGNQLGGFDMRWALPFDRVSTALYWQWIGEDTRQGGPQIGSWLRLAGVEFSGSAFGARWRHRTYAELADTMCREGGIGFGDKKLSCAYEHGVYQTGYRYQGRSIGHSADGDGIVFSAGSILQRADRSWQLSFRQIELSRDGGERPNHTLSPTPQDVAELSVSHTRSLRIGAVRTGVGYRSLRDARDARDASLDDRSFFGWIEFAFN
jgi:hypothetical protein